MRYAVIDAGGIVVNIILWDGVSPYDPGAGLTLVPDTDPPAAQIGGTHNQDGTFSPPAQP